MNTMNNSLVMFSTNNSLCKVDFSSTGLSSSFFVLFFFDNSYSSSLLDSSCENKKQRSHNLGKFPQIFAVSMGVVSGIMRILCIPFKILLFG